MLLAFAQPIRAGALAPCRAAAEHSAPGRLDTFTYHIRPAAAQDDLQRAAWLRAEAYYEERSVGRFKASFIKQFAGQHLYALQQQTGGPEPQCMTLVATLHTDAATAAAALAAAATAASAGPGNCIGTLDVRLLDPGRVMNARWPDGVPPEQPGAAGYLSNVVVTPAQRGHGLGRQLVAAAAALAQDTWAVQRLYCHVETDNKPALRLYSSAGFSQLGDELPPAEADGQQGRRYLLCRWLEAGG